MRIVIAGGTGFLGSPLSEVLAEDGHEVRVLTRSLGPGESRHESGTGVPGVTRVGWTPNGETGAWVGAIEGADAVVNLAGESISGRRWTPQRKAQLRDSRVLPTRSLARAIASASSPPPVFINVSAIGFYGSSGDAVKTEEAPAGQDFLAQLCDEWEQEAIRAERVETRVVRLRTGLVLERSGGALAEMLTPFRFFAGGPLGSGRQYMSWIHRTDWIEMVRWIIQTDAIAGPVNATAPHPVRNVEFAKALGHAIHRPSLVRVPAFVLRAVVGELAESLVTGQRAIPARAHAAGFYFRYPEIEMAFRAIFGDG
jgi:uncharacterized protein (TIGR01777 family)